MASLAEMMFQSASNAVSNVPENKIGQGFQAGAQLAMKQQQINNQKAKIQQAKLAAKGAGTKGVLELIKTAQKFKSESDQRRFLEGALPGAVEAYGQQEVFTPEMQKMLLGSQESRNAIGVLEGKVRSGEMELEDAYKELNMQGLAKYAEESRLQDAQKFAISQTDKKSMSKDQIEAARVKQQLEFEQFPIKQIQQKVTADWVVFNKSGGLAYVNDKLEKVDNAIAELKTTDAQGNKIAPKIKTGTLKLLATTSIPFTDKMDMIRKTNPEVSVLIDELEGIINLKKALDSSFSDSAANRVYGRIIDVNAPNDLNVRRVRAEGRKLLNEAYQQLDTFNRNNLKVPGELYKPKNFQPDAPKKKTEAADAENAAGQQDFVTGMTQVAKQFNLTSEDIEARVRQSPLMLDPDGNFDQAKFDRVMTTIKNKLPKGQ